MCSGFFMISDNNFDHELKHFVPTCLKIKMLFISWESQEKEVYYAGREHGCAMNGKGEEVEPFKSHEWYL